MAEKILGLHVKTWTWGIALVNAVFAILGVAKGLAEIIDGDASWQTWVDCILMVIWGISVIFLILALVNNEPKYILPHLVITAIIAIYSIYMVVIGIMNNTGVIDVIFNVLVIALIVFFIYVEYKTYRSMGGYHRLG